MISINDVMFIFQNINKRILYLFCPVVNGGIKTYLIHLKKHNINVNDNIVDSTTNQIIEAQSIVNKVFYLYYSQLFLIQYYYANSYFVLTYTIENNKFKFISKKYLINKTKIIDIQEIDKQGNILILTSNRLTGNDEILLSNSNNLFIDGIIGVNFAREFISRKIKEAKELEEDFINDVCESIEMKIYENNKKKKHKKLQNKNDKRKNTK